jgi:GNAT superfamily N-acetyltransferase
MGGIEVSSYVSADREAVIALVLGIQQREFGVPITLADQPDLADVPAAYQRGRGGFWTAKDDGRVVGVIGLLDGGGEVALRKMFVHAAYRGKGLTVASQLLDALLAHARAKGVKRIFLGTRPEMRAAHRFYEKNGFQSVATEDLPAGFPRMGVDSVFFRLDFG